MSTAGGTSAPSVADQFTYVPLPSVTAVTPDSGPLAGGTAVTITGTGFVDGQTMVDFGGSAGTTVTCTLDTSCSATSPPGSGTVNVTVSTAGGLSTTGPDDAFTYVSVPSVTAVTPDSGPLAGGTAVTITGTGFVDGQTRSISAGRPGAP